MPFIDDAINHRLDRPETRPPSDEFHRLVRNLSDILGPSSGIDSADVDPEDLINLMKHYTSDEQEWSQYALADFTRNYTRNLVDEGNGKSNLLILVWNPGKGSLIHDHANAHCVMKILKGSLRETLYTPPPSQTAREGSLNSSPIPVVATDSLRSPTMPIQTRSTTYHTNEVTYIADDIGLHKIENPSADEIAISLHLYTPPHAANYGFNLFCEKTGKQMHITQCEYFSNRGKRLI